MIIRKIIAVTGIGILLGAGSANAQNQSPHVPVLSPWRVSAYGTLGYSHESESQLSYVRDLDQSVNKPRSGSWKPDSRIGLQAGYRFNHQTEAVAQLVFRNKSNEELGRALEWAYVAYRPVPELQLRLGRLGIDIFMLSDYRSLGYAQTTVRPNWDFYGFLSLYSLEGIDATYSLNTPEALWSFKTQIGTARTDLPVALTDSSYDFHVQDFIDFSVERESGPWTLKAAAATMRVQNEAPFGGLTQGLSAIAAMGVPGISSEAQQLLQSTRFMGGRIDYLAAGVNYDDGEWLAQGEISRVTGNRDIYLHGTAAYLRLGKRIDHFTPYAGVSAFRPSRDLARPVNDWSALGAVFGAALPPVQAAAATANAVLTQFGAVTAVNSPRIDQNTLTLGVRWDFRSNAAVKLQWDHIRVKQNGYGLWRLSPATLQPNGHRVNLISASIDWVF